MTMTCEPLRNVQVDITENINAARRFASAELADAVAAFIDESTNLGSAFAYPANPEAGLEDRTCVVLLESIGMYLA